MSNPLVVCIHNEGHEESLQKWKIYRTLPIPSHDRWHNAGVLRVIDEEQEGYLYSEDWFIPLEATEEVMKKYADEVPA